jgi:8-oxo-dGTP diphosphatase
MKSMFIEEIECGNKIDGVKYRERIGAYALIIDSEEKIALVKRDNNYFLPGGGVENDESYEECLKRECSEEIGYDLDIVQYIGRLLNYTKSIKHNEYLKLIGHFYIGKLLDMNNLKIEEDHELTWLPINEAAEKMQEKFQSHAIREYIKQHKMIIYRKIDISKDKETLLEYHCEINYECESDFGKQMPYEMYRKKWLNTEKQVEAFISALCNSMDDNRTIAEILVGDDGATLGYIWVTFIDIADYNLIIAEINEIAVSKQYRNTGIATYAIEYIEKIAKTKGAHILRSGTGNGNIPSKNLHERCGFMPYRIEYEKKL